MDMDTRDSLVEDQEALTETETQEAETQQETADEKIYTEKDVDGIVGRKKAQWQRQAERNTQQKYAKHNQIVSLLQQGTGQEDLDGLISHLEAFYHTDGQKAAAPAEMSEKDQITLAQSDARDAIAAGYEEVCDEVERLAAIPSDKRTVRETATFQALAQWRSQYERSKQLAAMGVPAEVYTGQAFASFARQFNPNVPIKDIYQQFEKINGPYTEPIGSKKNGASGGEKTFYTPEEVDRLTAKDYENPVIMKRVRESMLRWKRNE